MRRNPNQLTFIYGLFDPETLRCRYIGRTTQPQTRLVAHVSTSKQRILGTPEKHAWINSLTKKGIQPIMVILEQCTATDGRKKEIEWVDKMLSVGADLVNDLSPRVFPRHPTYWEMRHNG